jgi:hypothetical protein
MVNNKETILHYLWNFPDKNTLILIKHTLLFLKLFPYDKNNIKCVATKFLNIGIKLSLNHLIIINKIEGYSKIINYQYEEISGVKFIIKLQ